MFVGFHQTYLSFFLKLINYDLWWLYMSYAFMREIMFAYALLIWLQCMIPERTKEAPLVVSFCCTAWIFHGKHKLEYCLAMCLHWDPHNFIFVIWDFFLSFTFYFFWRFGVIVGKALYIGVGGFLKSWKKSWSQALYPSFNHHLDWN
jgi:hypothetical protein